LRGLNPNGTYEVANLDVGISAKVSGKALMENGLVVEVKEKPGAAVIIYKKTN
jgi:hypothetical protein